MSAEADHGQAVAGKDALAIVVDDRVEQRYRVLVDHSPDAIIVHEAGRLVYVNPAAVRWMAATSADQLLGHPIAEFVQLADVPALLVRLSAMQKLGDSSEPSEATLMRFDGTMLAVEAISVLSLWEGRPAYQVVFRDITAHKAAEENLRFQAALIDHVSDAIIAIAGDGTVTSWNPAAEAIYQRSAAEALNEPISSAVGAPIDAAAIVAAGGVSHTRHRTADGSLRIMRISVSAMDSGFVLVCSDHTAHNALRRAEQHFQTVVDSLDRAVVVIDRDAHVVSANPAAAGIVGVDPRVVRATTSQPQTVSAMIAVFSPRTPDGDPMPLPDLAANVTLRTGKPVSGQVVELVRPDGRHIWIAATSCLLDPDDPEHSDVLLSFADITADHLATQQLQHAATHDDLTGLPNFAYVTRQISAALAADSQTLAAVMYVDLDQLKSVNDTWGHTAGDDVLKICSQRLLDGLGEGYLLARVGGDEFVVLAPGCASSADLAAVSRRLHKSIAAPLKIADSTITPSASIGIVTVGSDESRTAAEILEQADIAMYQAKASGPGQTRFHGSESAG